MTRAWSALLVAGWLGACASKPPPCSEVTPCPQVGEVCREGVCEALSCGDSSECPLESRCSAGACAPGCDADNDCAPADRCDPAGQCAPRVCEVTDRDCPFQHWCDAGTGACEPAGEPFCAPCSPGTVIEACNGGDPDGTARCWAGRCAVTCEGDGDCPSGFACEPLGSTGEGEPPLGCVAPCDLYE